MEVNKEIGLRIKEFAINNYGSLTEFCSLMDMSI